MHGELGRSAVRKHPMRESAPLAGSRANAITLPEALEVTYTVAPSGLAATPSAPSRAGIAVHAPDAPSRPSVPSELMQLVSVIAPVCASRLRIATAPKLVAMVAPTLPAVTYRF